MAGGGAYDSASLPTAYVSDEGMALLVALNLTVSCAALYRFGSAGRSGYCYNCPNNKGGDGGSGGGFIKINARDAVGLVSVASVQSNGDPGRESSPSSTADGGGGAGGSVQIHCARLSGPGSITCNGGTSSGSAGAGGGGRIALYVQEYWSYHTKVEAYGANSACYSAAGSVFSQVAGFSSVKFQGHAAPTAGVYTRYPATSLPASLNFVNVTYVAMCGVCMCIPLERCYLCLTQVVNEQPIRALVAPQWPVHQGGACVLPTHHRRGTRSSHRH